MKKILVILGLFASTYSFAEVCDVRFDANSDRIVFIKTLPGNESPIGIGSCKDKFIEFIAGGGAMVLDAPVAAELVYTESEDPREFVKKLYASENGKKFSYTLTFSGENLSEVRIVASLKK